jgi:hypothetical protein
MVIYFFGDLIGDETYKQLIKYQKILCLQEDIAAHTMDESKEVLKEAKGYCGGMTFTF